MSVFTHLKKDSKQSLVHASQYLVSEDKTDEPGTKPAEPESPAQPEAK